MKIDAVLARHPWPWRYRRKPHSRVWVAIDANGSFLFDHQSMDEETRDAILELVEAHVRAKAQGEASEEEKK